MYEKNTLIERIMEILERLDTRELRLVYFFAEGLRKGADCHNVRSTCVSRLGGAEHRERDGES